MSPNIAVGPVRIFQCVIHGVRDGVLEGVCPAFHEFTSGSMTRERYRTGTGSRFEITESGSMTEINNNKGKQCDDDKDVNGKAVGSVTTEIHASNPHG